MNSSLRDYALRMLTRREHSVHEFCKKLRKKFPEEDLTALVQEFQDQDWLSETRYCEAFIQHQKISTQAGPFLIHQKLRQKGVADETIKAQLALHFPEAEQAEYIEKLKAKKRPFIKASSDFEREQKLRKYLQGKGYHLEMLNIDER